MTKRDLASTETKKEGKKPRTARPEDSEESDFVKLESDEDESPKRRGKPPKAKPNDKGKEKVDPKSTKKSGKNVKGDKDTQTKSKVDKQSRLSLTGNTPSQVQAIEDWIQGKGILEVLNSAIMTGLAKARLVNEQRTLEVSSTNTLIAIVQHRLEISKTITTSTSPTIIARLEELDRDLILLKGTTEKAIQGWQRTSKQEVVISQDVARSEHPVAGPSKCAPIEISSEDE